MDRLARLVAAVLEPVRASIQELRSGLQQAQVELVPVRVRVDEARDDLRAAVRAADLELRDLEDLHRR